MPQRISRPAWTEYLQLASGCTQRTLHNVTVETSTTQYRGRVRTGCLTCRACKVRCDEQKPTCKRCARLHKSCSFPPKKTPTLLSSTSTSKGLKVRSSSVTLQQRKRDQYSTLLLAPKRNLARLGSDHHDLHNLHEDASRCPLTEVDPQHQIAQRHDQSLSFQLSRLISQEIYLCTTIDFLAAKPGGQRRSFAHFQNYVESPFVTPYDPANWKIWKAHVVALASQNTLLATAVMAAQCLHQARVNSLPSQTPLALHKATSRDFKSFMTDEAEHVNHNVIFSIAFLLSLVEMLVPQETLPGFLSLSEGQFVTYLEEWCRDSVVHSPLCLRLVAWLLISHAAACRSGGRGLLSAHIFQLLLELYTNTSRGHLPSLLSLPDTSLSTLTLANLSVPLFSFYLKLQLLSAQIADLSHYHRSRVTPVDQEEVTLLIKDLTSKIEQAWNCCPAEIHHQPAEVRSQFSPSIAEPLILLSTICRLTYHAELVEAARNLSDPDFGSSETKHHLSCIRNTVTSFETPFDDLNLVQRSPSVFLRALFLHAIESTSESDTAWAVSIMRTMKDTVCCSDFFANFSEGLAREQRQQGRRVTTKWWCLQVFGIAPPYL